MRIAGALTTKLYALAPQILMVHSVLQLEQQAEEHELANSILIEVSKVRPPITICNFWPSCDNFSWLKMRLNI
jgi:hypothetical protein